jgi:hypothetical protein
MTVRGRTKVLVGSIYLKPILGTYLDAKLAGQA